MSEDVFPRRNLPNAAEPWGRKHDDVVRAHGRRITNLELSTRGNNRANAGQLGVIGRQLEALALQQDQLSAQQGQLSTQQDQLSDQQTLLQSQVTELNQRSTHSTSPANLQLIRGGSSGQSGPVTRVVSLPAPQGGRRSATIFGSGSVVWTGTSTTFPQIGDTVSVGIEFRQSGSRRWFDLNSASSDSMFTFTGSETFSVAVPVQVPVGGSTWDLRMWVARTSSGGQANAGARLEGMNFTIVYGDKY